MNKQLRFTVPSGPLCLLLAMLAALGSGCTRAHYRRQADKDAYELVAEKANHPHWMLDDYSINVDPRSRMYDAGNPDRPPLPPDDPTAHQLMHCVDGKKGYPGWHDNGETPTVENTAWPAYIEFDEQGVLKLTSDDAVRLALLHSPNYQQNLEELYLSALDVSFERFRFDVQGFAGGSLFYTANGPRRGRRTGIGESSSLLELDTDVTLRKAYSTGATLMVNLANSLVWQFSGPDDYAGNTIIDFALFQPLLRGAGRDRILERLTRSERTLLANVRSMEQYRQSFYVSVMTGSNAGNGPSRQGGVFGGSGLEGFTGTGGGGFGRVGGGGGGGAATASGGGGAGAAQVGGYMGLLQDLQAIRNQEDNVERLRSNLFRSEQFLAELRTRGGDPALINNILRQDLQVAQARQALFNSESQLLNARSGFQASLDNFKTGTIGLPPQTCLQVIDPMLDQFQLIDRGTLDQQELVDRLIVELGDVRLQIASHIKSVPAQDPNDPTRTIVTNTLEWYPELPQHLEQLKAFIEPLRDTRTELLEVQIPRTEQDLVRFERILGRRQQMIGQLKQMIDSQAGVACPLLPIPDINQEIFNVQRLKRSLDELGPQLALLRNKISFQYAAHLDQREARINKIIAEGEKYTPEQLFDCGLKPWPSRKRRLLPI